MVLPHAGSQGRQAWKWETMSVRRPSNTRKTNKGAPATLLSRSVDLAETFKILGNPHRLRILMLLDKGERSVSEIEAALDIHQPTLSQQLGELRDAELLISRRAAKSVFYSVSESRGKFAVQAIRFASGTVASLPRAAAGVALHAQAARFASVLTRRGNPTPDVRFGFKSLLQEE